ncbi:4'-phosphopantetheinyl transferase family protein [Allokutzneria oryzae]|uniref:4'-phosphopantetheinyl transferase family protein n=1 Tax=Allokutzneria oryzae TaxID=1378989 RepID=UPI00366C9624
MSDKETRRADGYSYPEDRRRFVIARAMLRSVLADHLGVAPAEVEITRDESGRPRVDGGPDFNLSHSGELAALVVSGDRRVGADVERHRELDYLGMAERVFLPGEHALIAALPEAERSVAFFRYWTCKEACVKVLGEGLSALPGPELVFDTAGAALMRDGERWSVGELVLPEGYSGAVVSPGRPFRVVQRNWSG